MLFMIIDTSEFLKQPDKPICIYVSAGVLTFAKSSARARILREAVSLWYHSSKKESSFTAAQETKLQKEAIIHNVERRKLYTRDYVPEITHMFIYPLVHRLCKAQRTVDLDVFLLLPTILINHISSSIEHGYWSPANQYRLLTTPLISKMKWQQCKH